MSNPRDNRIVPIFNMSNTNSDNDPPPDPPSSDLPVSPSLHFDDLLDRIIADTESEPLAPHVCTTDCTCENAAEQPENRLNPLVTGGEFTFTNAYVSDRLNSYDPLLQHKASIAVRLQELSRALLWSSTNKLIGETPHDEFKRNDGMRLGVVHLLACDKTSCELCRVLQWHCEMAEINRLWSGPTGYALREAIGPRRDIWQGVLKADDV